MKLTRQQLKQIIKEEITTLVNEAGGAEKINLDNPGFGGSWCEKWEEIQANDPTMRLLEPEKWAAYKSKCDQEQNRQWLRDKEVDRGTRNPRGGSARNPEAEKTWDRRWGSGTITRTPGWRDVSENRMKLTKQQLKQIIKEELKDIKEVGGPWGPERYNPEDPSNTPEAIAKDEATTAMVNGLRAHLKNRGDLTPEALQHVILDVEEALVAGLEGVHIPAPEAPTGDEWGVS